MLLQTEEMSIATLSSAYVCPVGGSVWPRFKEHGKTAPPPVLCGVLAMMGGFYPVSLQ